MIDVRRTIASLLLCFTPLAAHADDGDFLWARGMGGASLDGGTGIAVDNAGNVYTTGIFSETVDFDPGAGNFNLTSAGYLDIFVQKLDASGNFLWARSTGGRSSDGATGIAVDSAGNVYTTGYFAGTVDFDPGEESFNLTSAGDLDSFVQKLDASGNFVWALSINGASSGIALDSAGNVYITGQFRETTDFDPGAGTLNLTSAGNDDIFVQKLDASGNLVWARGMGGKNSDYCSGIAVDSAGNVYITGWFIDTADFDPGVGTANVSSLGSGDIFVQKLDANGNLVWVRGMGGTSVEKGNGVAVDSAGNVYTTGEFRGTTDFDPGAGTFNLTSSTPGDSDTFVHKLDPSGNFVWVLGMDGLQVEESAIAADGAGNVYTAGSFVGTVDFDPGEETFSLTSARLNDIFVQKLDTSGNFVWARGMGGPGGYEGGIAIAVDSAGIVYATGVFEGTVDFDPGVTTANLTAVLASDIFVLKLSGPDVTPPNTTSIVPSTVGSTNATSVDFTVIFDEDVHRFDSAADLVVTHSGTASSGAAISGGPAEYTVSVTGISGDGSFTLAVDTTSDVQDLAGNLLATSVTSAAVSVDNSGPVFTNLVANPAEVSVGDTVSISFDSSEPVAGEPEVKVNGNPATRLAKADFAYEFTVQSRDVLGAATITISGADALGNVGALGDSTLLDIVRAEGEGDVEGEGEGSAEGEGVIEGVQEGEGEGVVEGAGDGEGEGENPPAGCGGCNAAGGPMEKSLGDWFAAFLGLAVLLGAHLSLRSRLET